MDKNKQELIETLKEVDALLDSTNTKVELFLVGGAAFILYDIVLRETEDIDFINRVEDGISGLLTMHGINNRAMIFDATFGEYTEDATAVDYGLKSIDIKIVNKYRLIISRLFSRKRHDDFIQAFKSDALVIEKRIFEEKFEDIFKYAQYIYMNELRENVYLIKEAYQIKGWNYETSRIKELCEEST